MGYDSIAAKTFAECIPAVTANCLVTQTKDYVHRSVSVLFAEREKQVTPIEVSGLGVREKARYLNGQPGPGDRPRSEIAQAPRLNVFTAGVAVGLGGDAEGESTGDESSDKDEFDRASSIEITTGDED